jgi:hypothetical protein
MRKELELKLVENYPDFFRGRDEPLTQNLMVFGCECGDGWYDLVDTFCKLAKNKLNRPRYITLKGELQSDNVKCEPYIAPDLKFVQIKEKFGTIRLYFDLTQPDGENKDRLVEADIDKRFDEIWTTIHAYENYTDYLSGRTCEKCGKAGKMYTGGWYVTLCTEHAKERGRLDDTELT